MSAEHDHARRYAYSLLARRPRWDDYEHAVGIVCAVSAQDAIEHAENVHRGTYRPGRGWTVHAKAVLIEEMT